MLFRFRSCFFTVLILTLSISAHAGPSKAEVDVLFKKLDTPERASALKKLRDVAEKGDPEVQYGLAMFYGVSMFDTNEQMKWLRKSAEQGYLIAQISLANMLVSKNPEEGVMWARKYAEKGVFDGESYLAYAYLKGRGVKKDLSEAANWFKKIIYNHPNIPLSGTSMASSTKVAAHVKLADFYRTGVEGVPKDLLRAYVHYGVVFCCG
jgi:TPR repeat protein